MTKLTSGIRRLLLEEEGVTSIEYALMGALIAVVCVVTITAVGNDLKGLYTLVCKEVSNAISGAPAC
jgi:pilus assembly protein Flp/PilA